PRWSHQVKRGMLWSLELFGSTPSIAASTVSRSKQCDADTADAFSPFQSCALEPEPITGNDEIRRRAAPIGMSVTVSTGSPLLTGLSCNLPARPTVGLPLGNLLHP